MDGKTKHQAKPLELRHAFCVDCEVCGQFAYPQYDRSDAAGIARRHTNWWQEHGDE